MSAVILDVTGWGLVQLDDYWHYVNHDLRLVTSGWGTYEAAIKHRNGYRDDAGTRKLMSERYELNKGKLYADRIGEIMGQQTRRDS